MAWQSQLHAMAASGSRPRPEWKSACVVGGEAQETELGLRLGRLGRLGRARAEGVGRALDTLAQVRARARRVHRVRLGWLRGYSNTRRAHRDIRRAWVLDPGLDHQRRGSRVRRGDARQQHCDDPATSGWAGRA
eukprot:scaffold888_cov61-Phaeocystis_antarctica.AAC.7